MSSRDPDQDLMLFGSAYGERQPDGSTRWIDPKDVIVKTAEVIHSRHGTPGGRVHLDWWMRPEEWAELAEILLSHGEFPYIAQLIDSGAVPNPFRDDT